MSNLSTILFYSSIFENLCFVSKYVHYDSDWD